MFRIPFRLPSSQTSSPSAPPTSYINTGSYDIMVASLGFRLANDTNFPYMRSSEKMSSQKISTSAEPGEQSLAELPWIREQSSFHGGAGQLNLETAYTAFQYQQEQIQHVRFDTCVNCDVWTPGKVTRLPDVQHSNLAIQGVQMVTATRAGLDYAIVGGTHGLFQVAWPSGPDALPTITPIDLTGSTFGGASNIVIGSLTTDGASYFALVQLDAIAGDPLTLTYVIKGNVNSTSPPTVLYKAPATFSGPIRNNLCSNPNFEVNASFWSNGQAGSSLAQTATQFKFGTKSMLVTWGTSAVRVQRVLHTFATVPGREYHMSGYVRVPAGQPKVRLGGASPSITPSSYSSVNVTFDAWERLDLSFTATGSSSQVLLEAFDAPAVGNTCYLDGVLVEDSSTLGNYFDGNTADTADYDYSWLGSPDASGSKASPIGTPSRTSGVLGWAKERLIGALGLSLYELSPTVDPFTDLPSAKYTHPGNDWTWTAVSESSAAVLAAGKTGEQSSILGFTLDTTGGVPVLSGGASVGTLPVGEAAISLEAVAGAFLAVGTTKGLRIATFDTFSGNMTLGPPIWDNGKPVLCATTRDRFVYAGYTNSQADGTSGLVCVDLGVQTDSAGRNAYAPHLKPNSGVTGTGTTYQSAVLPTSQRLVFTTPDGLFLEGGTPGSDGDAWLRTSRIREGTTIPKLFKLGRVRGSLNTAQIQVTALAPYDNARNCGTFGFTVGDPGEFRLIDGTWEWIQMKFALIGPTCVLNSYNVQSLPQQHRQRVIQFPLLCFIDENDRYGMTVTDPQQPHDRLLALEAVEQGAGEVDFVEFTNTGAVVTKVIIEEIEFIEFARPSVEDDFGGIIRITLRTTES